MPRKIVVLDSHQFDDNRISKHIRTISGSYDVLRVNYNFYRHREPVNDSSERAITINFTPTGKPYLNGLLFTLGSIIGSRVRELEGVLKKRSINLDDEVIFHVHDPYLLGLAKKIGKRFPRSRIVYDRHEYYETWKGKLGFSIPSYLEKRYGAKVAEIVFVSNHHPPLPGPLAEKRVTVIPNYPESKHFLEDTVKEKIGTFRSGDAVAVYFGVLNLGFDRDVELMFEVMSLAMDSNPGLRFEMAGRIYDEGIRKMITQMTERFGPRMNYLGEISYQEVAKRTMAAHLGFFLLRTDGPMWSEERPVSPNKIYEFLLSGTVPVVRATLDDAEAVEKCSLHFGKGSTAMDMAKAMTELINDQDRMRRTMALCRETGERFDWEKVAPLYGECYARLFESMH